MLDEVKRVEEVGAVYLGQYMAFLHSLEQHDHRTERGQGSQRLEVSYQRLEVSYQ